MPGQIKTCAAVGCMYCNLEEQYTKAEVTLDNEGLCEDYDTGEEEEVS